MAPFNIGVLTLRSIVESLHTLNTPPDQAVTGSNIGGVKSRTKKSIVVAGPGQPEFSATAANVYVPPTEGALVKVSPIPT